MYCRKNVRTGWPRYSQIKSPRITRSTCTQECNTVQQIRILFDSIFDDSMVNFINILRANFVCESLFGSFFYLHVTREKLPKRRSYKKFAQKCLWNWHLVRFRFCTRSLNVWPRDLNSVWISSERFATMNSSPKMKPCYYYHKQVVFIIQDVQDIIKGHSNNTRHFCETFLTPSCDNLLFLKSQFY